jgi:nucleotide-binding universal stress UspA family protein
MYGRILVPVDGSEAAWRGLDEAVRLAKVLGSAVRLLTVVDDLPAFAIPQVAAFSRQLLEALRARGEEILANAREAARHQGLAVDTRLAEIVDRAAGEVIVGEAEKWPADLIVLGTHGRRGLRRLVLGSDAEYVVRAASVPVLLVRAANTPSQG